MDIEVVGRDDQDLLGREEIELEITHEGEATPTKAEVRSRLSAELGLDPKTVEITGIYSYSGLSTSRGFVRVHEEPIYDELPEDREEEPGEEPADPGDADGEEAPEEGEAEEYGDEDSGEADEEGPEDGEGGERGEEEPVDEEEDREEPDEAEEEEKDEGGS